MADWNAKNYLKFDDERTRAAQDLVARVQLDCPAQIADLGCGPGNSSQLLRQRWPEAKVVGVDSSEQMLLAAGKSYPDQHWILADLHEWRPDHSFDLVYSNAALQWLPNHRDLVRRLFHLVGAEGALAFQIPSANFAEVRTILHEISHDPAWDSAMKPAREALTMESPSFYYDALCKEAKHLDVWESEYHHVLESQDAIVDWISSTGLRPFLAALQETKLQNQLTERLRERVRETYESRVDGKVLFPFQRTFVIAYR